MNWAYCRIFVGFDDKSRNLHGIYDRSSAPRNPSQHDCSIWQIYYRPRRSCGQGNVFTGVCLSTGGRVPASVHAGMPEPPQTRQTPQTTQTPRTTQTSPGPGRHPLRTRQTPPQDQADTPGTRQTPLGPGRHPPNQADTPRTRQTPYLITSDVNKPLRFQLIAVFQVFS